MADRLLFFVGVGGIIVDGSCPLWFGDRRARAGGRSWPGPPSRWPRSGARRIDVTWFGKAGTFGLMVAFPLFLASHSTLGWADTAEVLAWIAGIPGLVFGYISLVMYVPLGPRRRSGPVGPTGPPGVGSTP